MKAKFQGSLYSCNFLLAFSSIKKTKRKCVSQKSGFHEWMWDEWRVRSEWTGRQDQFLGWKCKPFPNGCGELSQQTVPLLMWVCGNLREIDIIFNLLSLYSISDVPRMEGLSLYKSKYLPFLQSKKSLYSDAYYEKNNLR